MIEVSWAVGEALVPDEVIREAAEAALEEGGRAGVVLSVVFVGEEELRSMHDERLGDPEPTDVMSFDLGGSEQHEGGAAGELYISVDRAREVAAELGVEPLRELLLYVIHGTLHLCGHDDHEKSDIEAMRAAEGRVLDRIGQPRDPQRHPVGGQ